jgi:hypothetical protein
MLSTIIRGQSMGLIVPKIAMRREGTSVLLAALRNSPNESYAILKSTPRTSTTPYNHRLNARSSPFSRNLGIGVIDKGTPPPIIPHGSSIFACGMRLGMYPHVHGPSNLVAMRIMHSSQQPPPNTPRNRLVSGLGMVGAGGMLLLGKGKYLVGALKLTKFASLGSMLLTVGAYTAFCEFVCFVMLPSTTYCFERNSIVL